MATFEELGIKTKASRGRYSTICPQCSSSRKPENRNKPTLTVNDEDNNQWFNCNHPGCGFKGNLKEWGEYEEVRKQSKMPKVRPALFSQKISEYLASRQISPEVAIRRGCYETKSIDSPVLCYPYYYGRSLVNVMFRKVVYEKGVSDGPREWQIKKEHGTKTCFWGLELLDFDKSKNIIITEGQTDCMTWDQCGYTNVLSIPMGASLASPETMEKKLEFVTDPWIIKMFEKIDRFYVFMDNDDAGIAFQTAIADKLGKWRCWIPQYPKGYKDSNEVYAGDAKKGLEPLGKSGIDRLFQNAKPYPVFGIIRPSAVLQDLEKIANDGFAKGLITGNEEWDRLGSLQVKRLAVLTGVPGSGKSAVWRFASTEYIKKNPWLHFAGYTPESRPPAREYAKIAEIVSGKRFMKGLHNSMTDDERHYGIEFVEKHFTIINPDVNNFETFGRQIDPKVQFSPKGLRSILSYMLYLKKSMGIFGFWIDAWNKLDHVRSDSRQPMEEYISRELDYLLEFLDINDLFCLIIAHPTKMERVRGGNYKIPGLYDIKGSSAWNEKADIGWIAHRNKYKKTNRKDPDTDEEIWEIDKTAPTHFICEKMKFDELGEEGSIKMWMDRSKGDRFTFDDPAVKTYESKIQEKKNKGKGKKVILTGTVEEPEEDNDVEEEDSDRDKITPAPF